MTCKNNFTEETIEENFGNTENSLKICNTCENFVYSEGIETCKYLLDKFTGGMIDSAMKQ